MLNHLRIRDFKGHRDTQLNLGRLTVLVGDNASGKTSVLEALELLSALQEGPSSVFRDSWTPTNLLRRGGANLQVAAEGTSNGRPWQVRVDVEGPTLDAPRPWIAMLNGDLEGKVFDAKDQIGGPWPHRWDDVKNTVGRGEFYSLRPDIIASAAYSDATNVRVEGDGENTAVVLAAMKLTDDEAFARVQDGLRQLVPTVERLRLHRANVVFGNQTVVGNEIYFDFRGAPSVAALHASHGTLLVLALLTILNGPNRPNLILLDDFDHALHPRAQTELVRLLQAWLELPEYANVQIVATTHSPYILDELDTSQVHAFAVRDDGTVATKPLAEHPQAEQVKGTLSAGQLWALDPERQWVLSGE